MSFWVRIFWAILFFGFVSFEFSESQQSTYPSLADHLHLSLAKDPIDGHWLPNLTGLPTLEEIDEIDAIVASAMEEEKDARCNAIEPELRMLFFEHFAVYQKMANRQNIYLSRQTAAQWAHVMGMTLKESSGDSTNITDFKGHAFSSYKPSTNLERWNKILSLSENTHIQLNFQTNFGLTQTSADRVFLAFKLASEQKYNTSYLEGIQGASTPNKVPLNTAIAIRRLIWFYQDFAQGRIKQEDQRIHAYEIYMPEYYERYQAGIDAAIRYCGTQYMFEEAKADSEEEKDKIRKAMESIAYCKLGNVESGYGKNQLDEKCFAQWVTICPALNIDIATITPMSYFATKNEKPVCESTFQRLLIKNPNAFSLKKVWSKVVHSHKK
jgi:hypothetical protein